MLLFAVILTPSVVDRLACESEPEPHEELRGFRDWVKNPDHKKAAGEYHAARKSLTVPKDISNSEIRAMVDCLFFAEDEDFNFDRLKLVGERAVPFLIEALEDPKTKAITLEQAEYAFYPRLPFERICKLLEPYRPPEAVSTLLEFIEDDDERFHYPAAIALGNIGNSKCIHAMLRALRGDDEHLRSGAMIGIQRGLTAGRGTDDFRDAMFHALTDVIRDDTIFVAELPAELILAIDAERALPILLSPELFTAENQNVKDVIKALVSSRYVIPHEILLPFLRSVKPLSEENPYSYAYAYALKAFAMNPDASTEGLLQEALGSSEDIVQEEAAAALQILAGIDDAREPVFDALDVKTFDDLVEPHKVYWAVFLYDAEVCNGGHAQYFVNSSGEFWKAAINGLHAIGDVERAHVLQEAADLFGPAGPSEDNETRHYQLAGFSRRQDQALEKLDDRYYAGKKNVLALLALYTIKHKQHFRTKQ